MPKIELRDEQEKRKQLETTCADMAKIIGGALPKGVAFAFMLADFGQEGNTAYCSNAEREDMIALLRETANQIEGVGN